MLPVSKALSITLLLTIALQAQTSDTLSPSESYKAALTPLIQTRNQPDDLTDADKAALGVGIARAGRDCLSLSASDSDFAANPKEVFALGQLCNFGQQFEPAREAFVKYLALPDPPEREQALALLIHALLGLKDAGSAEPQVDSLLRDYPYDALIHGAINQVIDTAEGSRVNNIALELCAKQREATLPLLAAGKTLEGKNGSVPAAEMFADAVRCVAIADPSTVGDTVNNLAAVTQHPSWKGTADLAPMLSTLGRQQMVGGRVPLSLVKGTVPANTSLVPATVSVQRGTVVLLFFALWSPSIQNIANELAKSTSKQPVYALTSWRVNTGRQDVSSPQVLDALRSWRRNIPKNTSMLIVPNTVLDTFHQDSFPAGVVIREGKVVFNMVISNEGATRLLIDAAERSKPR